MNDQFAVTVVWDMMEQETDLELEGPFLTLADFVRAQEIRERLRRRNKKPRSKTEAKSTQQTSTFELTATGHEETDHDLEERQSSYASDGRPGTSMSMATTAQTIQAPKKKMMHKMAQTVPQQGPQDPDMILRRYLFNVDWSRKVPNIDAACRCTDVYQKFRQGLKDVVAKKKASSKRSNPQSSVLVKGSASASGIPDDTSNAGRVFSAEHGANEASKSKEVMKMETKVEICSNMVPTTETLCFYEVRLNKDELGPVYDYTVDYRRYSYADFEVSDAVGSSTVLPEMLAAWIDKAMPRNQDDVYPLYVLCKDLLRKFCLRETRYSFKREEYLEKQVESLTQNLRESTEQQEKAQENFDQITQQHVQELKVLQERLPVAEADLLLARNRIRGLEHGNKLLLRLVAALEPRCKLQVEELENSISSIQNLEKTVSEMDSAFKSVVHEAEVGKQESLAQIAALQLEAQRLEGLNQEATSRIEALGLALEKSNQLNEEFVQHFNSVMARQPDEVVAGMTVEQKMLFFKALLRSPDDLIMRLEEKDLLSHTVLSLRYATCLFLREIRSKSANFDSWIDTIIEALGCAPEDLVKVLLGHIKDSGRTANLSAMDRDAPLWHFLKREMEQCNVLVDLNSFDKLKEGDEFLYLKLVGSESEGNSSFEGDGLSPVGNMEVETEIQGEMIMGPRSDISSSEVDVLQQRSVVEDISQGQRPVRSANKTGRRQSSAARETAAVRREEDYIVKKYGLFDMAELRGVKGFSIEDTVAMIGAIIDFKAESDYHCDLSIRPRLNMVKVVRLYIKQRCNKRDASETELRSLCRSVLNFQGRHGLVRIFGVICGMVDTSHWTERSACFFMEMLKGIKSLDDPGAESEDPDTLAEGWCLYRTWLNDPERLVKRENFTKGLETACTGMFGFGLMTNLSESLDTMCSATNHDSVPDNPDDVYLHTALAVGIDLWLSQLDESREKLKAMFVQNDINGDQELQMDEFIQLIKSTGYKMRQHDAMNMFHELAGPDDTVDQDEFSELVVFMKFNIKAILGEA